MWLLIVEALVALALLLLIVWWTMFHGRRKGEPPTQAPGETKDRDPRSG